MARPQPVETGRPTHHSPLDAGGSRLAEPGDMLNGVGSASSLTSHTSSSFSGHSESARHMSKTPASALTPLTQPDSSPAKAQTPSLALKMEKPHTNGSRPHTFGPNTAHATPVPSPPHDRPQARPPPGETKGYRAVWDPELDSKLGKEEKRKMKPKIRPFGAEAYEPDPPPDPRLAIIGYTSGLCTPKTATSKSKLRIAPYVVKPYPFDARTSIGPGPPKQVVVCGFDPFTPESQIKALFSSYGEIAELQNLTDPSTGSFLGVCLVKYRDSRPIRGPATSGAAAAKRAEKEAGGERIGLNSIKVERDREGRKCKRYVDFAIKRARDELRKDHEQQRSIPPPSKPAHTPSAPALDSPAPPPNAPKGPSGRSLIRPPPTGPKQAEALPPPRTGAALLVELEPVLSKIKRKPYIFISCEAVPVLGTTIPHLKKRMKAYDWREVRLDQTGYYVVFDDSKRGEDETVRCFKECNDQALFTYKMTMECQQYGNPDYERSPSPERAMAEKRKAEEVERLQKEEDQDVEEEKKQRALDLDPVKGAVDQLRVELRNKIMDDIKTRVAIPALYDCLDPTRHAEKRRKLGLSDSADIENKAPSVLLNKAFDTPPGTPRRPRGPLSHSKPLRPHDPNSQRSRGQSNAYIDERRRHRPAPRAVHARPLHFRLQQMFGGDDDDDSDDEHQTSRDTDDQESRPISRTSRTSTPFDTDSLAGGTPQHGKRTDADQLWEDNDELEVFDGFQKQLLGNLLQKRPEDMAMRELELVVNSLPRSSKFQKRAKTELFYRQRAKYDDELFQVKSDGQDKVLGQETMPDSASLVNPDMMEVDSVKPFKEKPKKKRKTKKQILEERAALEAEAEAIAESAVMDEEMVDALDQKAEEILEDEEEELELPTTARVEWGVSTDKPLRTVEDEADLVLDIDGWQHFLKDDEDLQLLTKALDGHHVTHLSDARLWAWKQKEIKSNNTGGVHGPVKAEVKIPGYYVANSTGSARTQGVQKILNSEKSKYLPHRIKVQKAREEREALAQKDPGLAAEAAKEAAAAKLAQTATSRSNRANNRRLVNDINLQKQGGPTAGSETDAFRFNQLKKRKKLVKFDRSAIHGWGLYAEENIAFNDLIIEYVGEKIRQKVADMREIRYEKQGIGSSYLFRMIDDEIVDATKKGGIARFINHSCTPNCTARIIRVEGTRRIVIYALKDIAKNEELTYDYKFEREYGSTDRIPCLCGSVGCKGFLN